MSESWGGSGGRVSGYLFTPQFSVVAVWYTNPHPPKITTSDSKVRVSVTLNQNLLHGDDDILPELFMLIMHSILSFNEDVNKNKIDE